MENKYFCKEMPAFPKIEEFENIEEYYDGYYSRVLECPLIFLPNNKIIFWGLEVTILKNEYDLLKAIIELNTYNPNESGYTEEELLKNIEYHRRFTNKNKRKSYQRFIITSISRIKNALKNKLVRACLDTIITNKYNPFLDEGKEQDHYMKNYISDVCKKNFSKLERQDEYISKCTKIFCEHWKCDKNFKHKVCNQDLNLVKVFPYMLNLTSPYKTHYSSFIFEKAFADLIASVKGQKHNSEHRRFQTKYIIDNNCKLTFHESNIRLREKKFGFNTPKTTPTRFNLYNFVNYPV